MRYRAKHTPGRGQEYLCVQRSGESRNFASHTAYRGLLRPSSVRESSHPSLKVFVLLGVFQICSINRCLSWCLRAGMIHPQVHLRIPCYDFFIL